ncbi:unnamed protein product [Larinioides sclopetarius]|uniref:ILCR1 Ig-like domain-containing protein n=1 Tax=Larinioides sclopetarius TaxID=280406 RepID=A0AAV1YR56_9ARAC
MIFLVILFSVKMPSFWICCVCLLLFLSTSDSVPYPSNRCSENDCSYQLQDFMNNTCKIYNTSVCLNFYNIEEFNGETLKSEEESKFYVSIIPYTAELVVKKKHVVATVTRSAINITFAINDIDINKLIVKLYKNVSSTPLCRIFDFHNANNSTKFPINLFYDCLYNLAENGMQNVRMDFIALPLKEKLSYNIFIPGTEYPGSCTWQPLIMVFRGNLHKGIVQVRFSKAPEMCNVSSYMIKLTQHPSGDEKIVEIKPEISKNMLFAQFSSVDGGSYSVSVKPVIWGEHHNYWTKTDKFVVEKPKSLPLFS